MFCYLGDMLSMNGMLMQLWRREFELVVSLKMRWRLYSSCMRSRMLHVVRKENEVALQRAEMRMVSWMYDVKVIEFQVKS